MGIKFSVTFDCEKPRELSEFWAIVLDYELDHPPPPYKTWEEWLKANNVPLSEWEKASAIIDPAGVGSRIFFQRVPESKVNKNRVHLDVPVTRDKVSPEERRKLVDAKVKQLEEAGAKKLYDKEELGQYWVTLADPEGNEFCLT